MDIERSVLEPQQAVVLRETVPISDLDAFFGRAFTRARAAMDRAGLAPTGPPLAVYYGQPTETVDVAAGFPVASPASAPTGTELIELPGGHAVEATYTGPYDHLHEAYATITQYMEQEHLARQPVMWEHYLLGPESDADPQQWRTRIVFPLVA